MRCIVGEHEFGIIEHVGGELEGDAVLREVVPCLRLVPLEIHHTGASRVNDLGEAWEVSFSDDHVFITTKDVPPYVRAVRVGL